MPVTAPRRGGRPHPDHDGPVRSARGRLAERRHGGRTGRSPRADPRGRRRRSARQIAEHGAVLLQEPGAARCRSGERDLRPLAVIGPTAAARRCVGGGGSSRVLGVGQRGQPAGRAPARAGAARTRDLPASARDLQGVTVAELRARAPLGAPAGQHGLRATPTTVTGATRIDPKSTSSARRALPQGAQATWTGMITAPTTGDYPLAVQTAGTGGSLTVEVSRLSGGIRLSAPRPDHRRPAAPPRPPT